MSALRTIVDILAATEPVGQDVAGRDSLQELGYDAAWYFAFALSVTETTREHARVLEKLVAAVAQDAVYCGDFRDTDVHAATRVRAWWA